MTQNPPDKILDRVRKLLRLAGNAGSEAEAASAAAKASDLMREHAITEATVALTDGAPATPEAILRAAPLDPAQVGKKVKRVAWRSALAGAVARSLGVRWYYTGGRIVGLGRESACQAWSYTTAYLAAEVERLCDAAWETRASYTWESARAWRNAFRVGCAHRVAERLDEASRAQRTARAAQVAAARAAVAAGAAAVGEHALVKVDRDAVEVDDAYARLSKNFGKAAPLGQVSSDGGYGAGRAAGDRVSLGGSARGGLPAGQGRLK